MRQFFASIACFWASLSFTRARSVNVNLVPAATGFEPDNTVFYYSTNPFLLSNDGGAESGGYLVFDLSNTSSLTEKSYQKTGRSKVIAPVYSIGSRDLFVTIAAPDSIMRVFDATTITEIPRARKKILGDWSNLCAWRSSDSGQQYLFLFGKKQVVQLLVRTHHQDPELVEIQKFKIPIEGETCTVTSTGIVFFSSEDQPLYSFRATESTSPPEILAVSKELEVSGLSTYHGISQDYLLLADDEQIEVLDARMRSVGTILFNGIEDLSIQGGLSVYQASLPGSASGAFAFAFEGGDETGVVLGSLEAALPALGILPNTKYSPSKSLCKKCTDAVCDRCSGNGFCGGRGSCECFPGFAGKTCDRHTCESNCSGYGKCIGPNTCKCYDQWDGPDCSFSAVKAKYETDANGGDGDDPAIWISPISPDKSRIVTTTKSAEGAGFAVFDLKGTLLQKMPAAEPNNVDIIYGFKAGNRTIDLTFAACRDDNTLCLFEVTSTGLLQQISGGVHQTPEDYEVYGSCTYLSKKSGKQYLFVNSKKALYLQYELSATVNGTLQTQLVRNFTGGSGGQVEGCVADDETDYLFLGEEPEGIWRYSAEPDGSNTGYLIAKVGDGRLSADVEGLTLVPAKNGPGGYLFVSSQGISAYLVYQRAPPHEYVMTFTIVDNGGRGIDHVSNTDGIAAVGYKLNSEFPGGLFVTHDDANELAEGGTAAEASFKLVSLADILGPQRIKSLGY
ncbi:hypothetical protein BCR34DRAFT_493881 [Clohesyomyces aquaticus]|uniref:3-phytase n=1 Tax=Clohesyomyces aquaticus TaxID=1231657 RepID=A0A1Y1YTT1_9PLEO|nr:hypothetical protein BCR34DRAFT_493881 [Clohesyomyces aquaticus]